MKVIEAIKQQLLLLVAILACWVEFGEQECWPAVPAAFDATNWQYRIMRFSGDEACNVASNAVSSARNEIPSGVLQNNPASGQAATIAYAGVTKIVAGAAVNARALITTNGSGQAVAAASGDMVVGRCITGCANAGEMIAALVFPAVRWGSVA